MMPLSGGMCIGSCARGSCRLPVQRGGGGAPAVRRTKAPHQHQTFPASSDRRQCRGRRSIAPHALAMPIIPAGFLETSAALPILTAACFVPPLMGFWKNEYTVSFGYAGAMALSGGVALAAGGLSSDVAACHAALVAAYGIRLGAFLLWRQLSMQKFRDFVEKIESRAPPSPLKRLPFILGCSALYLGMAAPVLLTARYAASAPPLALGLCKAALATAAVGGLVEAAGDLQKSYYKSLAPERWVDQGLYSILRHPNYTGEQLLWAGSFAAGLAAAAAAPGGLLSCWTWVAGSALGLAGIQFVLLQATTGLERRQGEQYGSSPEFLEYRSNTWAGFTFKPKPEKKKEPSSSAPVVAAASGNGNGNGGAAAAAADQADKGGSSGNGSSTNNV